MFKPVLLVLLLITIAVPVSAYNDGYMPHYVMFHFMDANGTPVMGNVSFISYGYDDPSMLWIYNMFGIQYNNDTLDSQIAQTDYNGTVTVPLCEAFKYNVTLRNDTINEYYHFTIYPVSDNYWLYG